MWKRIAELPCHAGLTDMQKDWIALLRAVGRRDGARMGALGERLLADRAEVSGSSRELLWMAALAGHLAAGDRQAARRVWEGYAADMGRSAAKPVFRLLRCHVDEGSPEARSSSCAAAFSAWSRP